MTSQEPSAAHPRVSTRVIDAQRHATWALMATGLFSASAAVAAVVPHDTGIWLPVHLFVVGGLLCAISGVTQMLAVTWSTAPAPTDRVAALQLALMVLGALGVAVGREAGVWQLVAVAAVAIGVGLAILAAILLWVRRWSATDRFHPAIDGYVVAAAWGLVGVTLGALAARGGELFILRLVEAHLSVNTSGLVGVVILATLPFFTATQLRMKMSPLATAVRVRTVVLAASLAVLVILVGELAERRWLISIGFVIVAVTVVADVAMLPRPARKQFDWAGPRLVGLAAGCIWWVLSSLILAAVAVDAPIVRSDALLSLVVGGYAQILVASAAYLAPVVRAGGHQRLSAGFGLMKSWPGVVAANLAALLLLIGARSAGAIVVALWALDTVVRAALLFRSEPEAVTEPQ